MIKSEQVDKISQALIKFQSKVAAVPKTAKNPFFNSKYADLAKIWECIQPLLTECDLAVIQTGNPEGMTTTVLHSSGQYIGGTWKIISKNAADPQAYGSGITYMRRYSLCSLLGVTTEDDDGERATGRGGVHPEQPEANDGVHNLDNGYRVPFGKWAKRTMDEIPIDELRSYVVYLEDSAEKKNKPIIGPVKDFVDRAYAHIQAFENEDVK